MGAGESGVGHPGLGSAAACSPGLDASTVRAVAEPSGPHEER
ncbi:hypothetical protein ABZ387_29555 [Streptomyces flaveolus]